MIKQKEYIISTFARWLREITPVTTNGWSWKFTHKIQLGIFFICGHNQTSDNIKTKPSQDLVNFLKSTKKQDAVNSIINHLKAKKRNDVIWYHLKWDIPEVEAQVLACTVLYMKTRMSLKKKKKQILYDTLFSPNLSYSHLFPVHLQDTSLKGVKFEKHLIKFLKWKKSH